MFSKKCKRCNNKISKEHNFCSRCGKDLSKNFNKKDYGMLGKEDNEERFVKEPNLGFGNLFGGMLNINKMLKEFKNLDINQLANEFNKEMKDIEKLEKINKNLLNNEFNDQEKNLRSSGISISISTGNDGEPKIDIKKFGDKNKRKTIIEEKAIKNNIISEEKAKIFSKLPREEAETNVRRIAKKLVYEILIPGVKSMEDVIINKLENSIEIKAFTNKKAYFKIINLNLPIQNYRFLKSGKLVLEFINQE